MGLMLAPPLLDGTIPAFYSTDQGIVITIPFSMNRVVSLSQVKGFQVKIKTVQSGTQLCSTYVEKISGQGNEIKVIIPMTDLTAYYEAMAKINQNWMDGVYSSEAEYQDAIKNCKELLMTEEYKKFHIGQYYKLQIAYVNNDDTIGYYSSVGIGKYTHKPELNIDHLNINDLNSHQYTYIGKYANKDKTERVYSYRFNLYNGDNKLVDTSGDLLHDTSLDDVALDYTTDTYIFSQDLPLNETYRIEYVVTTNNNLVSKSTRYRIMQKQSISPEIDAELLTSLNYDNGYISISLKAINDEKMASGFFILSRACEDTNYSMWDEVHRFSLINQIPTRHLYKDFTVAQGKRYIYAIQQYNKNGLRSNRIKTKPIYVDFEDAFLYDGKRQLKIKYNPKVASFKKDLLEQKTDTIGGKYPFIFRNGRVYYSEFSISGLISYQMDEENLFLSEADYGLIEKTTNLTGDNIAAEREFKMKVLEWLTNGEPKVFRSPAEGNYIVRLMNSSLSPNDTVGRMLHTFTSTAYEVADFNYTTLGEMGFISIEDENIETLHWETKMLGPYEGMSDVDLFSNAKIRTVRFNDMMPGELIQITFEDGTVEKIKISTTGSYYIDTGMLISGIKLLSRDNQNQPAAAYNSSITYSYYAVKEPVFETIKDVSIIEIPQHQFIGEHDVLQELSYVYDKTKNIWVKNPKLELVEIYTISAEKRPLRRITEDNIDFSKLTDPFLLYELGHWENNDPSEFQPNRPNRKFILDGYYDGNLGEMVGQIYEPYLSINNNIVSVNEKEYVEYIKPENITELKCGNGVLLNIGYRMATIDYTIEDNALNEKDDQNHYLMPLGKAISDYDNTLNKMRQNLENEIEYMECELQAIKCSYNSSANVDANGDINVKLIANDDIPDGDGIAESASPGYVAFKFKVEDVFEFMKLSFDISGTDLGLLLLLNENGVSEGEHSDIVAADTYSYTISKDDISNGTFSLEFIVDDRTSEGKQQFTLSNIHVVNDIEAGDFAEIRSAVRDAYTAYIIELVAAQKEDTRRKGEIA